MAIPPYPELCNSVLKALHQLGGSAKVADVERTVADLLHLSAADRAEMRSPKQTRLSYRVAWARFYLKKKGYLESTKRGVSVLSEKGKRNPKLID